MAFPTQSDTKAIKVSEWLIHEYLDSYTRDSAQIQNDETTGGTAGAITVANILGQPVKLNSGVWEFASGANVTTGGAGNVDGFVASDGSITALAINTSTSLPYPILRRGPAIINELNIPATDVYGDAIVAADYVTECLRLNIQTKDAATTTTTQTT